MAYTIAQILDYLGSDVINTASFGNTQDLQKQITKIAAIEDASDTEISFISNPSFAAKLSQTSAGAVLITESMQEKCPSNTYPIVVASPYLAYAKLSALFAKAPLSESSQQLTMQNSAQTTANGFIHPTAILGNNVQLGDRVTIGAYCHIGDNCVIGSDVVIEAQVNIQPNVTIGEASMIAPHVYIGHDCVLGKYVSLHSHASIGNEGFGFAPKGKTDEAGWQKIHQLGRVIIGDHVRVGSHSCIDRGAINDTVIGNHVIIDNLVQIAHNVKIGAGTAIAACVGIAGSTEIGKRCMIGGASGVSGHIKICDDVTITGMTMVTKSIHQPGVYSSGMPVMPNSLWKKAYINFKQLGKTKNQS